MPIDGVRSLSRASDVLSGCSYGIILRRLHAGGGISVPTTPSHPSSSTAAAKGAPSGAKLWRVDTPRCAIRWPRLRLCFRTAGSGMHQDRLPTAVVAFSMVPGLPRGPGVHFVAAELQRHTKVRFVRQSKLANDPLRSTASNSACRSAPRSARS